MRPVNRLAFFTLALTATALLLGTSPALAGSVKVQRTIPFAKDSGASENVKSECALETKVPTFLSEYSADVELVDGKLGSSGRVLQLTISNVQAPGGGAFSGPKFVTVKGSLRENGKEIGSFTATRYSTGGAFSTFKGTCAIVGRCAKAIGRDIAEWLKNPQKGSQLGDA